MKGKNLVKNENEAQGKPAREFTSWRETKNPRFTPTTYNLVANVIADALACSPADPLCFVATKLATKFEIDNSKFDKARFLKACGYAVEVPKRKGKALHVSAPQFPKKGGI